VIFRSANLVQFAAQVAANLTNMIKQKALQRRRYNGGPFLRREDKVKDEFIKNLSHGG
jgi:hypothetical protein